MTTQPDASLSRLLTLVEQWQVGGTCQFPSECDCAMCQLQSFDVPAFRAAAQQHAEALRGLANYLHVIRSHDPSVPRAAADWLDPKEEV